MENLKMKNAAKLYYQQKLFVMLVAITSINAQAHSTYVNTRQTLPSLPAVVPVASLPAAVYKSPEIINQWVAQDKKDLMKAHAWELFIAAMQPLYKEKDATIRLFDTWHSLDEVVPPIGAPIVGFNKSGAGTTRKTNTMGNLDVPEQSAHSHASALAITLKNAPPDTNTGRDYLAFSEASVSDVKYNLEIGKFVESQLMNTKVTPSGETVVVGYNLNARIVPNSAQSVIFDDTKAVMIKPAFTIIKGKGPTVIGRWDENINVTNPDSIATAQLPGHASTLVASERTWRKEAIIYPSNSSTWPEPTTYYGRDGLEIDPPSNENGRLMAFNLSDFHYIKLTQAQVDSLKTGILKELMGPNIDNIEVGDYAILTSFHISTREINDWTWQTFWWQPTGSESLYQNGVQLHQEVLFNTNPLYKPLKHFRTGVGYSYATANKEAVINANPYLEGSFGMLKGLETVFGAKADTNSVNIFLRDESNPANPMPLSYDGVNYVHTPTFGLKTNCVTCHRAAAYPLDSYGTLPASTGGIYPDYGLLKGNEDLFVNRVTTGFLWGVVNKIAEREADVNTKIEE
jgi:hypothetical protein